MKDEDPDPMKNDYPDIIKDKDPNPDPMKEEIQIQRKTIIRISNKRTRSGSDERRGSRYNIDQDPDWDPKKD